MTLKPCLDCGVLTASGWRCQPCKAANERRRGTTAQRGYGGQWARYSKQLTTQVGCCERCGTEPTLANPLTTDHVIPLSRGGPRLPDRDGVAVLCRLCNSAKGAR